MTKIAVLQMTSGINPDANMAVIEKAVKDAKEASAKIIFTPEMALLLDRNRKRAAAWIESDATAQCAKELAALAINSGVDIALGSMPVAIGQGMWANRSFYFSASRDAPAPTYDKIHMFDVELESGETWRESSAYKAGERAVAVDDTPIGTLGLTICYDMRFPALFEALGQKRCDAIAVPAAFTVPTGKAHWHLLLRARAIEASAFVIAAAQVGDHADGRSTYGRSLVAGPWGEVLLDMGDGGYDNGAGIGLCDLDHRSITEVRAQLPSLANRRAIAN